MKINWQNLSSDTPRSFYDRRFAVVVILRALVSRKGWRTDGRVDFEMLSSFRVGALIAGQKVGAWNR